MTTRQILLTSRPVGDCTLENFKIQEVTCYLPKAGEVLLKGLYYSVDPYMRGRMNDAKSYAPPFQVGQPISGAVVAQVVESKSSKFRPGDLVLGNLPWQEQFIAPETSLQKIDAGLAPPSYYLSILGMTGLTAYFGLSDICRPKAGETLVISGAAGAVGIVAGQIAKLNGCHVVGIAGSDEKTGLLKKQFGFDEAINYKTAKDLPGAIAAACPRGVDMYFDNVGGEISDAVISQINFHARIALCGQIALYNSRGIPQGPRLQPMLLTRSVLMQGFIIGDYKNRFGEGIRQLSAWVKEGKLTFTETRIQGFEQLPLAMLGLFQGKNTGKMVVVA